MTPSEPVELRNESRPIIGLFEISNGTLGPVLWCPDCDKQIGFLTDRITITSLIDAADHHARTRHAE